MARSAVNFKLWSSPATPYTVPAGKVLIGKAYSLGTSLSLSIDGVEVCKSTDVGTGPITANAGQTLTSSGGQIGFSGFIYDV